MTVGKLSLAAAVFTLIAAAIPVTGAQAHGRHWRSHDGYVVYRHVPRYRVVYRHVPRYRVVYRPRYYATYGYRPYRSYYDGYYGWGGYSPGFALRVGGRHGFIGIGGNRLWW